MPSFRCMSFMGTLPDICKVLQCLLPMVTHSQTHRHLQAFGQRMCGCSICMWLCWPPSLGLDLGPPLESRVMAQESTSGPVRVYVHVSSSPRWRGVCVCVCLMPGNVPERVRKSACSFLRPVFKKVPPQLQGLCTREWMKVSVSVHRVIENKTVKQKCFCS